LQFMIENEGGGAVSFVDFRFVALLDEEGDEVPEEETQEVEQAD